METQDGPTLGLMAVASAVPVADKRVYVVGGKKLGKDFLSTLALSEGMRALVYLNLDKDFSSDALLDANGAGAGSGTIRAAGRASAPSAERADRQESPGVPIPRAQNRFIFCRFRAARMNCSESC